MTSIEQIDISAILNVSGELARTVQKEILRYITENNEMLPLRTCAPLLGTTPRSLQRHLANEGYVYDDLTLNVKKYNFCKLVQSGMLFQDIAGAMGFKGKTSVRAFTLRHWNLNPRHIRKLLKPDTELYS